MTTKVIFNVDKNIKERAARACESYGITMTSYLSLALSDIADGKRRVEIVDTVNDKTLKKVKCAILSIKNKRNKSPTFNDTKSAMNWLNSK